MRNFYGQIIDLEATNGVYRVWVHADGREGAPLVARWIDPRAEENGSHADHVFQICEERYLGDESAEAEIDPALQLTFTGAF